MQTERHPNYISLGTHDSKSLLCQQISQHVSFSSTQLYPKSTMWTLGNYDLECELIEKWCCFIIISASFIETDWMGGDEICHEIHDAVISSLYMSA